MKPVRSAPTNLSAAGRITAILFLVSGLWMPTTHAQTGNTKTGDAAMVSITTGDYNTADGLQPLNKNTSGSFNTGVGVNALSQNTTATYNTATGSRRSF